MADQRWWDPRPRTGRQLVVGGLAFFVLLSLVAVAFYDDRWRAVSYAAGFTVIAGLFEWRELRRNARAA